MKKDITEEYNNTYQLKLPLEIENNVKPGTQLQLQNQFKYNVNYLDDNKTCTGIIELRITETNMNPFELKLEMVAEFGYGPEDEKPDIYTASFDQLFPFVRQIVHSVTSFTGIPGLLIPIIRLNKEVVRVNEPIESSPLN